MKIFLFILESTLLPVALNAQSNAPAGSNAISASLPSAPVSLSQSNLLSRGPTEIFSDRGDFDLKTHTAIYSGNVRVIDPQMKLTCDILTAVVPEGGGRVDRIVAERNVVIDGVDSRGERIRATGDKAVYRYWVENLVTNETIELTGNPKLEERFRSVTGDPIVWDRINSTFYGSNLHMIFLTPTKAASTNAPTAGTTATNAP
jgi:lipopolysaccharide transport protein LptA